MPLSNPTTPERDLLAVTYDKVKEIRVVDTDDQSKVLAIENLAIAGTKVTVAVEGIDATDVNGALAEHQADIETLGTEKVSTTTEVIAGAGLTGGGTLDGDVTLNVNTYNGLDSTSTTRPLSAAQGKALADADVANYAKSVEMIAHNATAPSPVIPTGTTKTYEFSSGGVCAWLANQVVEKGDKATVAFTAPSTFVRTFQDVVSRKVDDTQISQTVGTSTVNVPSEMAISNLKESYVRVGKNLFNKRDSAIALGYYLNSNGTLASNSAYNTSGFIRVSPSTTYSVGYLDCAGITTTARFVNLYNSEKVVISQSQSINTIDTSSETYYIRLSVDAALWPAWQVGLGDLNASQAPYVELIKSNILGLFSGYSFSRNNITNYRLSGQVSYISKHNSISAHITGIITNFYLGFGYNVYMGGWVELTQTHVIVHFYNGSDTTLSTNAHGLTLSTDTVLSITTGQSNSATIILVSGGVAYKTAVTFTGIGTPFFYSTGSDMISVSARVFASDSAKDIWLYGDSYLSFPSDARWMSIIMTWGYLNFLVANKSGGTSADLYSSFINDSSFGHPKYVVWCLGMNDGADTDAATPNASWLSYITNFLSVCNDRGYTPVFATIPSVPSKLHDGKNAYIRSSGYRYIDMAAAVGAQSNGTWKTGMLSGDNVHPSVLGATAMASRVLLDFPEIMLSV